MEITPAAPPDFGLTPVWWEAATGLDRARDHVDAAAAADLTPPFTLNADPDDGVHMLVLDEVLYAAERGLVDPPTFGGSSRPLRSTSKSCSPAVTSSPTTSPTTPTT
jgi:hypothetical protein